MNEIPNLNNKNIVVKIRFDVLRFFFNGTMVELVDTADLNSRENCSKKSDIDSNINYDGFVPHTVNNLLSERTCGFESRTQYKF